MAPGSLSISSPKLWLYADSFWGELKKIKVFRKISHFLKTISVSKYLIKKGLLTFESDFS
jgi:hypothetical protein